MLDVYGVRLGQRAGLSAAKNPVAKRPRLTTTGCKVDAGGFEPPAS